MLLCDCAFQWKVHSNHQCSPAQQFPKNINYACCANSHLSFLYLANTETKSYRNNHTSSFIQCREGVIFLKIAVKFLLVLSIILVSFFLWLNMGTSSPILWNTGKESVQEQEKKGKEKAKGKDKSSTISSLRCRACSSVFG